MERGIMDGWINDGLMMAFLVRPCIFSFNKHLFNLDLVQGAI